MDSEEIIDLDSSNNKNKKGSGTSSISSSELDVVISGLGRVPSN